MEYINTVFGDVIIKAVISNPKSKTEKYRKIVIERKLISGTEMFQVEKFTEKQAFHENVSLADINNKVEELFAEGGYRQLDAKSETATYMIKVSKKGKETLIKKRIAESRKADTVKNILENNRKKKYILSENTSIPPLVDLGVFTKDGHVVNAMYDKYKQINRFVELVDDVIDEINKEEINIIDFGCGKSYLTFILYYYLTEIKKIKANIIGLDLKADVIEKCNSLTEKYGYTGLHFEIGDINGFRCAAKPDMVITLHACDTATDYAMFNSVKWGAKAIISVPCCQHELNSQIHTESLLALTDYGLIKERFSALATDAIRGKLLESMGYKVQMLEFVDFSHSPKNLLIRAIKKNVPNSKREKSKSEAKSIMEEFNFMPTLYKLFYN